MKREILFRGKRVDNGEWVEGDLIQLDSRIMIADRGMTAYDKGNAHEEISLECVEVAPGTVGQFTGLTDKDGKRIFEGDKVKIAESYFNIEIIGFILYHDGRYLIKSILSGAAWDADREVEVIGTIHDNPELL